MTNRRLGNDRYNLMQAWPIPPPTSTTVAFSRRDPHGYTEMQYRYERHKIFRIRTGCIGASHVLPHAKRSIGKFLEKRPDVLGANIEYRS